MVQLVVMAQDKINEADFNLNCALPKRGDVIAAFADDYDLTKFPMVFNDPNLLIISIPDATIDEIQILLENERDPNPTAKLDETAMSKTLQFRASRIDLDTLALNEPAILQAKADVLETGVLEARVALIVEATAILAVAEPEQKKDADVSIDAAIAVVADAPKIEKVTDALQTVVSVKSLKEILNAKVDKQPIENQNVIGDAVAIDPNLIG